MLDLLTRWLRVTPFNACFARMAMQRKGRNKKAEGFRYPANIGMPEGRFKRVFAGATNGGANRETGLDAHAILR
jgi:hypothetical protein